MSGIIMQGFAVLLVCASVGCSAVSESSQAESTKAVSVAQIPVVQQQPAVSLLDKVVWNAQKQQGKMYRWGGTSPVTGFDCSGLTQYAFKNGARVAIPRTAAQQYAAAVKVSQAQSQKGDLVFFNTSGKRVSHVGIYLGNDKFVHAPRKGRAIATDELKGYWSQRLIGFGRIPGACKPSYS
ncbi:C40 family peptidase [Thiothrix subterranea]|uniref:C40 family peptidase n=1 Tax=Thiothrix subterranea TaxID=2735563 RepID=A0ABU0Y415_9GAMM|nr:C40 family peptidase [Thiothrix subterranea]MDQ5767519.1 C40 family peptidase [Thiothrix subterranea]